MKTLFYGGDILPMTGRNTRLDALLIRDNIIIDTGDKKTLEKKHEPIDHYVDLKGRTLLPGFNDSHMHLLAFGESLQLCKLEGTGSIAELKERVHLFAKSTEDFWIVGRGWNQDYFLEGKLPSASDLDAVVPDRPVVLSRACGHILVCNSIALEAAGISKNTLQPAGGAFDVDHEGRPTGILRENAMALVFSKLPEPSEEKLENAIIAGAEYALSQGFTSVQSDDLCAHPMHLNKLVLHTLHKLSLEKRLPIRVDEQSLFITLENFLSFIDAGYKTGKGDGFFKEGPLKILADGSLGARTAFLTHPYEDAPDTCGIAMYTQDELTALVLAANQHGIPAAIHAIGDRTIDMALEAFRCSKTKMPEHTLRNSIVHCQITRPDQFETMKSLGVLAHVQPIFIQYDKDIVQARLGEMRGQTTYAWRTMLQSGIALAFGSDCPVEAMDIMPNLFSAIARTDLSGNPHGGWMPAERLDAYTALEGFTIGGAYASGEEDIKGSLEVGKLADFVILDQNPLKVSPQDLLNTNVLETWVDGSLAYRK